MKKLSHSEKREEKVCGRQFYIQILQSLTSTGFCVPSVLGGEGTSSAPKSITIVGNPKIITAM